ncbi:alanine dehydrogenase [Methylohalobius crimeensis]|uniref:alanine dehydrogenase n=1 Tax=Methylohalobius crimeensis TaxID=244365 RepID=UPI001F020667|nr:alanine dehydrogenase [Methylohalobius crimeensis]
MMRIGVPKETKTEEYRVALTPEGAQVLVEAGHPVTVERGAGEGSGFSDEVYRSAGARLGSAAEAWDGQLVLKVKEPQPAEYGFLRGQIVFTYFHLAATPRALLHTLLETRTTAVAYETLGDKVGGLPLLAPMSGVAGNMATLMGAYYLACFNGGRGTLLANVLDIGYGKVVIIGDGVVGQHAAQRACAMKTEVAMAGLSRERGEQLKEKFGPTFRYFLSTPEAIAAEIADADLVVGAVLVPGARAPYVVSEAMVQTMPQGSVIVDVSIDQGGCVETSHPTTHGDPVFVRHDVIHYCVANMPGAYPRAATLALTRETLPSIRKLAAEGLASFVVDPGAARAVNTYQGWITYPAVAEAWEMKERYRDLKELLS